MYYICINSYIFVLRQPSEEFCQEEQDSFIFVLSLKKPYYGKRINIMASTYLTEEGLHKLRAELDRLKGVERPAASRAIAEARDKGDLSENAEYDAAKEAQGLLEMKISQMETMLANAKIIDDSKIDTSKIQLLNTVKIKNLNNKAVMTYALVTETEADLKQGKLSIATPIAKALLGKKVGDVVHVEVPSGMLKFEVMDISI